MENEHSLPDNLLGISRDAYGEEYANHVVEIYKLYVEMADRISSRRQSASSFFLTINSSIVALVGYVNLTDEQSTPSLFFYVPVAVAGMALSYLWYRLIVSYKQLNSGKFTVIHAIESMLPLRPYDAEWSALGKGKNPRTYTPFTHIEVFVPWVFFTIHVLVFLASLYFTLR